MKSLAWATGAFLAFVLVMAPYTIQVRAHGEQLSDLGIVQFDQGSCGEGKGTIVGRTADGTMYAFGENGHAIRAEVGPEGPSGQPVVTYGAFDTATGEITFYGKTKHQAGPDDWLSRPQPRCGLVDLDERDVSGKLDDLSDQFLFADLGDLVHL